MDDKKLIARMDTLEAKLDLVLEHVNQQRLKAEMVGDLMSDISIVGKDIYDTSVAELENQSIEIDPEQLRMLGINLIKNIGNINDMLMLFGSILDLMKDAAPIANEVIIDLTKKLHEFEEKRYPEFFREVGHVMDRIVTNVSPEDIRKMGDHLVLFLNTLKSMDMENIPQYSLLKVMRQMGTKEMKTTMGFMMTLLKNLASKNNG